MGLLIIFCLGHCHQHDHFGHNNVAMNTYTYTQAVYCVYLFCWSRLSHHKASSVCAGSQVQFYLLTFTREHMTHIYLHTSAFHRADRLVGRRDSASRVWGACLELQPSRGRGSESRLAPLQSELQDSMGPTGDSAANQGWRADFGCSSKRSWVLCIHIGAHSHPGPGYPDDVPSSLPRHQAQKWQRHKRRQNTHTNKKNEK